MVKEGNAIVDIKTRTKSTKINSITNVVYLISHVLNHISDLRPKYKLYKYH